MSDATAIKPERPVVPASLYALVCVILAERWVLGAAPPLVALAWTVFVCAVLCAITVVIMRIREETTGIWLPVLLCGATVMALVSGFAEAVRGSAFESAMATSAPSSWTYLIVSDPTETEHGFRSTALAMRRGSPTARVWVTGEDALGRGDRVVCVGRYAPNEGDVGLAARRRGVWGSVRVMRVLSVVPAKAPLRLVVALRHAVLGIMLERVTPARAVMAGAVLGGRDAMRELGLDREFSTAGVSHLVAVSGTHIALVSSMASVVLGKTDLGPRRRGFVLLVVSAAYVVLCGAPPSALRAWAMSLVAFGSELAGRRGHALSSACLVGLVLTLATPGLSGDLGFLLSVASVCSICLVGRYLSYALETTLMTPFSEVRVSARLARRVASVRGAVCDIVGVTLAAQLATVPLAVPVFGEVSLVSPLANLVMAPVLPVLMAMGFAVGALSWAPALARVILVAADVAGWVPLRAIEALSRIPVASVPLTGDGAILGLACAIALVALVIAWPDVDGRALSVAAALGCAALATALVIWRWFAPARVCVLDVGQGDAILVQDGGRAVLVDAGPEDAVTAALSRNHVMHLDAVIVTHLHDDHYGGVVALADRMGCDQVIVAKGVADCIDGELAESIARMGAEVVEVSLGDKVLVGRFALEVVWPESEVDGSENAHSIEALLTFDSGGRALSGLLTGDAEQDETRACVEGGRVGDIDFLKVGHHGSEVSIDHALAAVLDPEVSVASAGAGNSYGHPSKECVNALKDAGSLFLCTIECGDVEIRPGSDGPVIRCQKGFEPR